MTAPAGTATLVEAPALCPRGHGAMRRRQDMSTGNFPGFWHDCTTQGCPHSDFVPLPRLTR